MRWGRLLGRMQDGHGRDFSEAESRVAGGAISPAVGAASERCGYTMGVERVSTCARSGVYWCCCRVACLRARFARTLPSRLPYGVA